MKADGWDVLHMHIPCPRWQSFRRSMSGHTRTRSPICSGSGAGAGAGGATGGAAATEVLLALAPLLLFLLLLVLLPLLLLLLPLLLLACASSAGAPSAQPNLATAAERSGAEACRRVRRCDSRSSFECERELLDVVVVVDEEGTFSALMLPSEEPSSFPFPFPFTVPFSVPDLFRW